ncbi:MAG: hypothetical protein E7242_01060 [Lachnospiraceae bacterium]|nr:hypothetical protein [Lachnospiraceae bacterium]
MVQVIYRYKKLRFADEFAIMYKAVRGIRLEDDIANVIDRSYSSKAEYVRSTSEEIVKRISDELFLPAVIFKKKYGLEESFLQKAV